MNTAAKPSEDALVRKQVKALLASSPAFHRLPAETQHQIASNTIQVLSYLAAPEGIKAHTLPGAVAIVPLAGLVHEVDFPNFVASLIDGVFQAIVTTSIEQMQAYAELVKTVAGSVDQFAKDTVADEIARRRLATQRQQLLASMLLMGINRIVVTNSVTSS